MKYAPPFGSTDPNASYVDRNTPGAVTGSKVPAKALENVQRELVALIQAAGLTPSDSDLAQVAKAIQSGALNFATSTGPANAYAANLTPAPSSYRQGMVVYVAISNINTGASTLNLNGLGALPILNADASPVVAGDLRGYVALFCDGSNFWRIAPSPATESARGIVQLASAAETAAGTNTSKPASVARMAAAVQNGVWNYAGAAGGVVNAYTASITPAPTAYNSGLIVSLWFNTPNTGPATLNLNGLGAKGIYNSDGSDLVANDLVNEVVLIYFSSAFFIVNRTVATEIGRGVVQLASAAETTVGANILKPASVARMAATAQSGSWSYAADTGTADAMVVSLTPAPASYTLGMEIRVGRSGSGSVGNTTTTPTININGLGAKTITSATGGALGVGDIVGNSLITLRYDGVNFRLMTPGVKQQGLRSVRVFFASTTFTVPANVYQILIEGWGGGGGGGGGNGSAQSGGGGGGSGYFSKLLATTPGTVITITIGNSGSAGAVGGSGGSGGTTTVTDGIWTGSATGGGGGISGSGGATGGAPGAGSGGDENISGGGGFTFQSAGVGGAGGSACRGGSGSQMGNNGNAPGGGGGSGAPANAGAIGGPGEVRITY